MSLSFLMDPDVMLRRFSPARFENPAAFAILYPNRRSIYVRRQTWASGYKLDQREIAPIWQCRKVILELVRWCYMPGGD